MSDYYSQSTYGKRNSAKNKQMHYSPGLMDTITNAISHNRVCTIEHDSHEKGISIRDIEPMAIVYKDSKRHLVAYCRLREDFRTFRLDRLNVFKLKHDEFTPRPEFNVADFEDGSHGREDDFSEDED